jgi:hypothetical protein
MLWRLLAAIPAAVAAIPAAMAMAVFGGYSGDVAAIRTLLGTCSAWCLTDWSRRLTSQPFGSVDPLT